MKRTPVRRSTKPIKRSPLPRGSRPLARGKPPRARKPDPKTRRFAKHRCKPFTESLKREACCVCCKSTGEWSWYAPDGLGYELVEVLVDPAHTRPRSLGADDLYECIPLARHLHEEQERIGWPRFEKKYGINRHELARGYADRWLAHQETP